MFGMNGWCKEPNNAGNGSDCPKNAQNSEDRTTGDLISRAAAINEFAGAKVDEEYCTEYDIGYNDGIDFAVSRLSVLPSAQPERKKGEWIEREVTHIDDLEAKDIISAWQSCKCSVCGRYDTRPYMYYFNVPKYCSWCGAKMEVSE